MTVLRNKLRRRRGAAIVIALIFLLCAAIIGSIVLASATSNAGRLSHMRAEQQAYLSVSSAAALLCSELEGMRFQDTSTVYDLTGLPTLETTPASIPPQLVMMYPAAGNSISNIVSGLVEAVYMPPNGIAEPDLDAEFTIEPESGPGDVNVLLTISDAPDTLYQITAELTLDDPADTDMQYTLIITMPVDFSDTSTSGMWQGFYNDGGVRVPVAVPYSESTANITYGEGFVTKAS